MSEDSIGRQAIESTCGLLSKFVDAPITIERRDASVVVTPNLEDGFAITVYDEGDQAMIAAERWHTHEVDPIQVAFCVMWLLTPFYRIVHEFRGGLIASAWLERYEEEGWAAFEPAYFLNPEQAGDWPTLEPDGWDRQYRQQFVLPSPRPYTEIVPDAILDDEGWPVGAVHGSWSEAGPTSKGIELY